jgi:cobalt/nickel transport protein
MSNRKFIIIGLLLSVLLAGGASFYASSSPDGLEKVAGDIGFIDTAKAVSYTHLRAHETN